LINRSLVILEVHQLIIFFFTQFLGSAEAIRVFFGDMLENVRYKRE
jgi:hypothetical protein